MCLKSLFYKEQCVEQMPEATGKCYNVKCNTNLYLISHDAEALVVNLWHPRCLGHGPTPLLRS